MNMPTKFRRDIFVRFVISYGLILLFAVSIGVVSTGIVLGALERNSIKIAETAILSSIKTIDDNLKRGRSIALSISENVALKPLINADSTKRFAFNELLGFRKIVGAYNTGEDYITDLYIHNSDMDLLIDQETIYSKSINFYSSKIVAEGETAYTLHEYFTKSTGYATKHSCVVDNVTVLPYIMQLPTNNIEKTARVVVLFNSDKLLSSIINQISENNGCFLIFNYKKELLVSKGALETDATAFLETAEGYSKKKINGGNYYIFNFKSGFSQQYYITVVPENYILSNARFLKIYTNVIHVLSLLIGFIICIYFVSGKTKSYAELLKTIGLKAMPLRAKTNEFEYLIPHASRLHDQSKDLYKYRNEKILRILLTGDYVSPEDIEREMRESRLIFSGSRFGVVLMYCDIKTSGFAELNFRNFIVQEMECIFDDSVHICFVDKSHMAILFSFDFEKENFFSEAKMYISRIQIETFYKFNISVMFGISDIAEDICGIAGAYKEANEVIEYNILTSSSSALQYSDLPKGGSFLYSAKDEQSLLGSAVTGDFKNIKLILNRIYKENFIKRKLSLAKIKELMERLQITVKKTASAQAIEVNMNLKSISAVKIFEYVTNFFYLSCTNVDYTQPSRGQKICLEIKAYIKENYEMPELSLTYLADYFHFSPTYLSTLFKKHTNITLINYIENIRIEKAVELISAGKHSIDEIAELTGFSSSGTFRQTFKRHKGVSPSFYLKN